MNTRRIIAFLASLLLVIFAVMSSTAATAKAATTAPSHQLTLMGITSSGQIINLEKPPSWLKPNTLIHPLKPNTLIHPMNYISPDTLYAQGYQICKGDEQCINDWGGGGLGTLLRYYQYGESNHNNQWNWWYEGTVSGQQSWPFTAGTGINDFYNDNPVYKFTFAPGGTGTGNCISQQLFTYGSNGSDLNMAPCANAYSQNQDNSKFQYFVLSGTGRVVAVKATNFYVQFTHNNNNRIWIGIGPNGSDANGTYVYLVSNQDYAPTGFHAVS